LFHYVLLILDKHRPEYVFLENVGNFEQHDGGRTWAEAKKRLKSLGYTVVATEHVKSGGSGLISPHHLGYPHARERFYAVCRQGPLPSDLLPKPNRPRVTDIWPYLQAETELTQQDAFETKLSSVQISSIQLWNKLHLRLETGDEFPWFPLWSDEFGSNYPYQNGQVSRASKRELLRWTKALGGDGSMTRAQLTDCLPSYSREGVFPTWKVRFIRQNREWCARHKDRFPDDWLSDLRKFPSSYRKIEWNCKGEDRDLWKHVLQFRPSGIRVKRIHSIPALVSLTTTQIPIIGPLRRYITRVEGLRFQGFPDSHRLPDKREAAFRALGNAVHVGVATEIAARLLGQESPCLHLPGVDDALTTAWNVPAAATASA
jgi:DNA (cytosine-5)-methyltransferase 1